MRLSGTGRVFIPTPSDAAALLGAGARNTQVVDGTHYTDPEVCKDPTGQLYCMSHSLPERNRLRHHAPPGL